MRTTLLTVILLLLLCQTGGAQTGAAGIQINAIAAPVDRLSLADVDFVHSTAPKWLFTIDLRTEGGRPADVYMRIQADVVLSTGETFSNALMYETFPFTIQGQRTFTNLDFINSPITKSYETNKPALTRFEQTALPSGTVPAGVYVFRIEVVRLSDQMVFRSSFRFVLTNPSVLELVFPPDNDNTMGLFPLFQWNFDGPRSRIAVFEKLSHQTSREEIVSGTPHLLAEVAGTSFLYPGAGARPLESGKTYVWFVEGFYGTSGGTESGIKSPLRSFSVSQGTPVALASVLEDLERALGPKYKPLFDQIRSDNLAPSGVMRLDGVPISIVDLLKIVNRFQNGSGTVISAEIE